MNRGKYEGLRTFDYFEGGIAPGWSGYLTLENLPNVSGLLADLLGEGDLCCTALQGDFPPSVVVRNGKLGIHGIVGIIARKNTTFLGCGITAGVGVLAFEVVGSRFVFTIGKEPNLHVQTTRGSVTISSRKDRQTCVLATK